MADREFNIKLRIKNCWHCPYSKGNRFCMYPEGNYHELISDKHDWCLLPFWNDEDDEQYLANDGKLKEMPENVSNHLKKGK